MHILSLLYVQLGVAYLLAAPTPESRAYGLSQYDRQHIYNPYGVLAIGLESDPYRKWSLDLQLRHQSSLPKNDWGDNSINLTLKYRPFGT